MEIEGETHTSARVADWGNVGKGLGVGWGKRTGRGIVAVKVAVVVVAAVVAAVGEVGTVAAVVVAIVFSSVVVVVVASGVGSVVGIGRKGSEIDGPESKGLIGNVLVLHVPVLVTVVGQFAVRHSMKRLRMMTWTTWHRRPPLLPSLWIPLHLSSKYQNPCTCRAARYPCNRGTAMYL